MIWIGLTGGLASGKSTVSNLLKAQGLVVIDADEIAHQALQPGEEPYKKVVSHFGTGILFEDGSLNRKALAALVFNQDDQLRVLEAAVHPFVQARVLQLKEQARRSGQWMAVYDVPLLFEKNLQDQFDRVVTVATDEETQIARVQKRNQFTREEALARLRHQLPMAEKVAKSDDVIWNKGTLEELETQTRAWLQKLKGLSSSKA